MKGSSPTLPGKRVRCNVVFEAGSLSILAGVKWRSFQALFVGYHLRQVYWCCSVAMVTLSDQRQCIAVVEANCPSPSNAITRTDRDYRLCVAQYSYTELNQVAWAEISSGTYCFDLSNSCHMYNDRCWKHPLKSVHLLLWAVIVSLSSPCEKCSVGKARSALTTYYAGIAISIFFPNNFSSFFFLQGSGTACLM